MGHASALQLKLRTEGIAPKHSPTCRCFHDRDIAPEGASLAETNALLDKVSTSQRMDSCVL